MNCAATEKMRQLITRIDDVAVALNLRPVDATATDWRKFTGKDSQLDVAVRELLAQIGC